MVETNCSVEISYTIIGPMQVILEATCKLAEPEDKIQQRTTTSPHAAEARATVEQNLLKSSCQVAKLAEYGGYPCILSAICGLGEGSRFLGAMSWKKSE